MEIPFQRFSRQITSDEETSRRLGRENAPALSRGQLYRLKLLNAILRGRVLLAVKVLSLTNRP